ncbi:nucleoside-triphosphatase [Sporobacter termitidis DSM 10068]|uniref:Nucleoside-triphosphatase n=1 Tax=Sporobacter termitidis DSM 10068 TaxID=1123282 RepID=A0A1M5Z531_9FIRM|nr:nucleoside-triphosphatase [Sporobacter termitidis]SHI19244.1 nucleoside-triphosphatase [Sporobacter termitidis DSM 10068]
MKHVFLTGEIQIGKSTVIQKALSLLNVDYGGFRTYFSADRARPDRRLYIGRAGLPLPYGEENTVARFSKALPPQPFPERFDTLGTQYIAEAAESARLIVMDECGNLEDGAPRFQRAVFTALEGAVPVLGVLKLSSAGWVDEIRRHQSVALISVDAQNRDALPRLVADSLRPSV